MSSKPWRTRRWDICAGHTVRPAKWPDGMHTFYCAYVGTSDELVEAMRSMGISGQAIRESSTEHPSVVARRTRKQAADRQIPSGDGDQLWCLLWDEYPTEMWDGRRNTHHPDHLLAAAGPPGMSSMEMARGQEILVARLRVARAQWELDELIGDPAVSQ
ncbi:hypothetical protein GCM10014719_56980 [Planomonospora parontospora subsp. antibiotica]|nr:hypothetical protein GCM10014719_56980 [Planomonospora parontospora subsp. antibiotica]GII18760.1 hypothetical protein Ppa05_54860 [Planomonospora parontospora subsp. antibiotica]